MGNTISIADLRMRALRCAQIAVEYIQGQPSDIHKADVKLIRYDDELAVLIRARSHHGVDYRLLFDDCFPANGSILEYRERAKGAETVSEYRRIRFRLKEGAWIFDSISDWGRARPDLRKILRKK